jgi:predicted transcriptional regulator
VNAGSGAAAGDAHRGGAAGGRRPNGALEAEVLAALQVASGPLTAAQVLEHLGGGLAYTTVVTTLSRLYDKQVLSRVPSGRAFAYAPVTDASGLTARRMHQVLRDGPDREQVLTRFVSDLSTGDAALLRALLETDAERESDRPAREG